MKHSLLAGCVASVLSAAAVAQNAPPAVSEESEGLENVVVTATRRSLEVQDIPQTITALSEQNLKDLGSQDFAAITNSVAGVELRQDQAGQGSVGIRGIVPLDEGNLYGGTNSISGVYVGELPLSAAGRFPVLSPFDMQRVEILKGPQGTLFGEGSLSGTVRFIPNAANPNEFGGAADLLYSATTSGGDNYVLNGMLNIPIAKDLAGLRVAGYDRNMGGYINARMTDGTTVRNVIENANTEDSTGGRAILTLTPGEKLQFTAMVLMNDTDNGFTNRATTKNLTGSFSTKEYQHDSLDAYNFVVEYSFDFADLVASYSYTDRGIDGSADQASFVPVVQAAYDQLSPLTQYVLGLGPMPHVDGVYGKQNMKAQSDIGDIRLVSNGGGALQWTVGAFYKATDTLYSLDGNSVPAVPPEWWGAITSALSGGYYNVTEALESKSTATIDQWAIYGEASYDFSDQWQVLAGGRYFEETRDSVATWSSAFALLTGGTPPGSEKSDGDSTLFLPKFSVTYHFSPDMLAYALYNEGFRSGGQNDFVVMTGGPPDYDPETLDNMELGFKSTLADNRVILNLSAYYMDWHDLQQVVAQGIGGIGESIGNVGDAHSLGMDLETRWLAAEGLEIGMTASLLQAELDNKVVLGPTAGNVTVPKGTRIPGAAEWSLGIGAGYRFHAFGDTDAFLGGRLTDRGDIISSLPTYKETTPGATTLDLRTGLESEHWQVYLFAANVTNSAVPLRQNGDNVDIYTGQTLYFWGSPRTIGVNLRMGF
ncbi:MAG: TonB-dependent receptor [Steroidobacteraceae bacterium]